MADGQSAQQESFSRDVDVSSRNGSAPSEKYVPVPQQETSVLFGAHEGPQRVQSSTNLDLVECVGSDLLLAMNCLDVSTQGRLSQAASYPDCADIPGFPSNVDMSTTTADASSDSFLPLAARGPPPSRRPAWLTSQQEQARVQNEHFPARHYSDREITAGKGGCSSVADSHATGREVGDPSMGDGDGRNMEQMPTRTSDTPRPEYYNADRQESLGFSGEFDAREQHLMPNVGGAKKRNSVQRTSPHLDESWTAVLNAPAGAELMEYLTEQPSRALVLWNVEAASEKELRASCEVHGPLYYIRAEHRRKRVVFIAYYDMRDATNAHRSLSHELSRRTYSEGSGPAPAVHFSIELHAGFSYKEGCLWVRDLPSQVTEADIGNVFQAYGDLRGVSRLAPSRQGHAGSFNVEFFNIQDARVAAQELSIRNPWGHSVTVEPAARSDSERRLGRQLHATLNRWTKEATQAQAIAHASALFAEQQHGKGFSYGREDRLRSGASSVGLSGRSSDSDSPPPKHEGYGRELMYMMDSGYTPMTSANTTPATTPGSTPPSGAEAYHYKPYGGASLQHYKSPRMLDQNGAHFIQHPGPSPSNAVSPGSITGGGDYGGSSGHQFYASSHHCHSNLGATRHYGASHVPPHVSDQQQVAGQGAGKMHTLVSPLGPVPYSSPGAYYLEMSPGYHGDRDDAGDRTPGGPTWSPSSSSAGGGSILGIRGSSPLHDMTGGGLVCHSGPGGVGYNERPRQGSLDEGRVHGMNGGSCGSARTIRCSSDSLQLVSPGVCSGSGGDEFSLDLKKVSKGLDKRTTIMIRNIPNKYTQAMLLQEIDSSYRGAYDFFYLPIDFKNKCNVGYAFINFMDYRRIVSFFRDFNGQRWKNFNSEKVCAISYARIQGKASMISRFQNSSLMEKDGEYRPLIFHSSGAARGRPEPFPASSKVFRGNGGVPSPGFNGRDRDASMNSAIA